MQPQVILLQDLINQTSDYNQNYDVSTIDTGNVIRAINRAIEFVQRRLGLPSDRQIFTFSYYEDTKFYNLPTGYTEYIQLYYNTVNANVDTDHNSARHRWESCEDVEILRSTGQYNHNNRYAFTTMNGSNQIMLDGHNLHQSVLINSFDQTSGITFSSRITGATTDSNIYKQGAASIVFNMGTGESTSTITIPGVNYDIRQLLNTNGDYRFYIFFPTATAGYFTDINIQLQSSTGNYYKIQQTADYLGNAWNSNGWSLLSFPLANTTTVGSPNAASITQISINFDHSGSFQAISNMRIDDLYTVQPDLMDLVFYSAYKGTDTTGLIPKIVLTAPSDILYFGAYAPDLIHPICLKAATILWPQLRADLGFLSVYKQDFTEAMLLYGKSYPKKRNSTGSASQLLR